MTQKTSNPSGKLGGEQHRKKVMEVFNDVQERGLKAITEYPVALIGKAKSRRDVDVAGLDEELDPQEFHQIGKQNKDGRPVKREREAIADIEEATGITVQFHAYNV